MQKVLDRYARTLFRLSLDNSDAASAVSKIADDMRLLAQVFVTTPELKAFLDSPLSKKEQVRGLFGSFSGKISPLTGRFLDLLIEKNRASLVPSIPDIFLSLYESHQNILRAKVLSAKPLSETQISDLKQKLMALKGARDVIIENSVDTQLIAGIRVRIGDTVIDSNVKSKLQQLRQKLVA